MCGVVIGILIGALIVVIAVVIESYDIKLEWVKDINLNSVLIIWYNKCTDGYITREHKILYDTGRNKK